jgi:glycosyltransferase involved in cell wall biosynthesis
MPWRYDVVGFFGGDFGLAVAARNTIQALSASCRPGRTVSVEPSRLSREVARALGLVGAVDPTPIPGSEAGPEARSIALFQMNPPEIAWYSRQWRGSMTPSTVTACVPFWELPLVPAAWVPLLQAMDVVLAPTRFVQAACASVVPPERVLHYPQAVFLPEGVRPDRDAWGLPRGVTTFVVSFDIGSDMERKNPWAALEAFREAFPDDPHVRLVIKTKPWPKVRAYRAQAEELRARAALDRRILMVDRSLPYAEVLGLSASGDVMVSLHRSEGLGLHLMEAMSLGRVVVATDWSGNRDFMTGTDSVPVDFRLVPVATRHSHYLSEVGRPGQVWAEADIGGATRALRVLHEHPDRRQALAAAATVSMQERRRQMLSGAAFERLETIVLNGPRSSSQLQAALRTTRRQVIGKVLKAGFREALERLSARVDPRA